MQILILLIFFAIGSLLPVQTSVNSKLAMNMGSALVGAFVSFFVGFAALVIVLLIQGDAFASLQGLWADLPWWAWFGGCAGVIGIVCNIAIFPKIGSVQTVLLPMLGQMLSGVLIDTFGWFDVPAHELDVMRLGGIALVVLGILLVVLRKEHSAANCKRPWFWRFCGLFAGIMFGLQPSLNGKLCMATGSAVQASIISCATGAFVLLVLILLFKQHRCQLPQLVKGKSPWWTWCGGLIGASSVLFSAAWVSSIGVSLLVITSNFGMLVCSLLIDHFGWMGATQRKATLLRVLGLVSVLAGIVMMNL